MRLFVTATQLWCSTNIALQLFDCFGLFFLISGNYECRMKNDSENITVIQRSKERLTLYKTPLIRVTPITTKVACEIGKVVTLTCVVESPYVVEFQNISAAGRHVNITHTHVYIRLYIYV